MLDQPSPITLEDATIVRLRRCSKRRRPMRTRVQLERALEIALEVEETELEDWVWDLLKALQAPMDTAMPAPADYDLANSLYDRAPLGRPRAALAVRRAGE